MGNMTRSVGKSLRFGKVHLDPLAPRSSSLTEKVMEILLFLAASAVQSFSFHGFPADWII